MILKCFNHLVFQMEMLGESQEELSGGGVSNMMGNPLVVRAVSAFFFFCSTLLWGRFANHLE